MWERGLKLRLNVQPSAVSVAPHVGAWIETSVAIVAQSQDVSLPMWERGLKLQFALLGRLQRRVAPHVGAWIETASPCGMQLRHSWSLPMWERGLKLTTMYRVPP